VKKQGSQRVTKAQMTETLEQAAQTIDSLREALTRANLTIATVVHVAEGGSVASAPDAGFDANIVDRCSKARDQAARAAEIHRSALNYQIDQRGRELEALKTKLDSNERVRHLQAAELRRLEGSVKRRHSAAMILQKVVDRNPDLPSGELDVAIAGVLLCAIE
jgi:hypothetical protein